MKKKIIIGVGIIGLVLLIIIGAVIINRYIKENEILNALEKANIYLSSEKKLSDYADNTYGGDTKFSNKITTDTTVKDLISKIIECRKYFDEDGKLLYLFEVEIKEDENTKRAYIIIDNEGGMYLFPTSEDVKEMGENSSELMNFWVSYMEELAIEFENMWKDSNKFTNVNYEKIYNKL